MSIGIIQNVWEHSKTRGNDRLLMLAIADNAGDDGFGYPGYKTLEKKVAVVRSTLKDCLDRCEESGELFVDRSKRNNRYLVVVGLSDAHIIKGLIAHFEKSNDEARTVVNGLHEKQSNWSSRQTKQKAVNQSKFQTRLDESDESSRQTSTSLAARQKPVYPLDSNRHLTVNLTIKDQELNADAADADQHELDEPESETEFEYPIGSTVYYVEESKTAPAVVQEVLIIRRTKCKVWIGNETLEKCVYETSLTPEPPKLERKTDALQDVIVLRSFGLPADACIAKGMMYTLNILRRDIMAAWPNMTAERLDHIYSLQRGTPSRHESILAMIKRFEDNTHDRHPTGRPGSAARNGRRTGSDAGTRDAAKEALIASRVKALEQRERQRQHNHSVGRGTDADTNQFSADGPALKKPA